MSTTVSFNGVSYEVPETGETSWGEAVSSLLIALATFSSTTSSQRGAIRVATATPVTVASNDYTVVVRLTVPGAATVNLPAGTTGQLFAIVDGTGDAATNPITIVPNGSESIGVASNYVINANNGAVLLQYNTTNTRWQVVADAQGLLTNADIAANAGIAFSKLAALPSGTFLMGSPSNVVASYFIDGDVAVGPGGISAIQPGVIVDADVNASAAIAATKLANAPSGNLAATTVQGALNELQTDVDTRATSAALTSHVSATTGTHGVTGTIVGTTDTQSLTNKTFNDTSNVVLKGGNTGLTFLNVGTTDASNLNLMTNGATRLLIAQTADLVFYDGAWLGTSGVYFPRGTTAQRPASASDGTFRYNTSLVGFEGRINGTWRVFATQDGTETLTNKRVSSTSAMTGALELPAGSVAQRPTPVAGHIRLNTDSNEFEGYASGAWQSVGGGVNERPEKNYLKAYATASVAATPITTVPATLAIATTAGLFHADTSSGTGAITQLTDTSLRGSANYLSNVAAPLITGTRFFQFPAFQLEAADVGKPVSVSFDVTGVGASGDWDVVVVRYSSIGDYVELIPVAGTASGASATPSARLPTGTAQFRGFFVAGVTSDDRYALRFRRLAGSTQVRLDTLYVGPQAQLQGAAVTDSRSYTDAITGGGSATYTYNLRQFRQVGDCVEVEFDFSVTGNGSGSANVVIPLPSGLNLDTTKVSQNGVNGFYQRFNGTNFVYGGTLRYTASEGTAGLTITEAGTSTNIIGSELVSGNLYYIRFTIPIANWSSNVTMAERAVEEYAFNSSATTTADTTSFGNGASGVLFQAFAPTGLSGIAKRVRFQSPIQTTDRLVIEVQETATSSWIPVGQSYYAGDISYNDAGTQAYGIQLQTINTTDVDVIFYQRPYPPVTWLTSARWRLRKVSGGGLVGFPVGARNVVGDTSGTAVPTGYIGETLTGSPGSAVTPGATGAWKTVTTVTLTPGVWRVRGVPEFLAGTISGWTYMEISLSTATDTRGAVETRQGYGVAAGSGAYQTGELYLVASASTTVHLVSRIDYTTLGTANYSTASVIRAVRIA